MKLACHASVILLTAAMGCGGGQSGTGASNASSSTGGHELTGAGPSSSTSSTSAASSSTGGSDGAGGASGSSSAGGSGSGGGAGAGGGGAGGGGVSAIRHVVIVVQENHTFDAYFGAYCTAPAGSEPTCNAGPSCCEGAPATDPSGTSPTTLDDAENAGYDPNHTQACELSEMNGGAMDMYTTGASCSDARNFAVATTAVQPYWALASQYAIADRYFQPIVGQSSSNDMYLAVAHYDFTDNDYFPDTNGHGCTVGAFGPFKQFTGNTVGDLMLGAGLGFAFYAEGYAAMKASLTCPSPPSDCPFGLPTNPCDYDPSDVPFEYYAQFADNPLYMKDYQDFVAAVAAGTLPELSYIKGVGYHNEHPGYGTRISDGAAFVGGIVDQVMASPYADDTLILVTWDEGGGFFDHVTPPPESTVDQQPYGTRVPLIAVGRFARTNFVSHVPLEHPSIVAFVEYNFLGQSGQLGARDATAHNLGSLLDPKKTGIVIPE